MWAMDYLGNLINLAHAKMIEVQECEGIYKGQVRVAAVMNIDGADVAVHLTQCLTPGQANLAMTALRQGAAMGRNAIDMRQAHTTLQEVDQVNHITPAA